MARLVGGAGEVESFLPNFVTSPGKRGRRRGQVGVLRSLCKSATQWRSVT